MRVWCGLVNSQSDASGLLVLYQLRLMPITID
jgi:hypothetical protein